MIINLAPTGMIPTKEINIYTPITPKEIINDVLQCAEIGINIVHIHARDQTGKPTYKKEIYKEIIEGIREKFPKLIICVSLSGRMFKTIEERSEPLFLAGDSKPDMGSLTLSSLNFIKEASINSPDVIEKLARIMQDKNIKPELEVFDVGMVNYAKYLIKKELIKPPFYFNIILGNIASAQIDMLHLATIIQSLPPNSLWCVGGIGTKQLEANVLGMLFGNGIRIGIEDNPTAMLSNSDLLKQVKNLASLLKISISDQEKIRNTLFPF